MSLKQTLYFMSLVGATAGLFSWAMTLVVLALGLFTDKVWVPDAVSTMTLGAWIGGFTIGFSDRWSGSRVTPKWVVLGVLIGLTAGFTGTLIQIPITANLSAQAPFLTRVVAWMLAGSLIGLGLGLRWVLVNRLRPVHSFVGGLVGGAVGGTLFAALSGRMPDFWQALGFMLAGLGICFGVTLAPILLQEGVLQFISSGDPRAQSKLGRSRTQWEIRDGDSFVIGSQGGEQVSTRFRPDTNIFIPDSGIAPRHATLYARSGRFMLARHQEAGGQAGLARYILRVRGKTVTAQQDLQDNDDILIGRTSLKFSARRKQKTI